MYIINNTYIIGIPCVYTIILITRISALTTLTNTRYRSSHLNNNKNVIIQ